MSFGGSKSSNQAQQQSQSTSQQQLNPQILSALLNNYSQAQSLDTPYQPYTGEQVAPLNATQLAAGQGILGIAANNTGGAELGRAEATTNQVAGYTPSAIAPSAYSAVSSLAALQPSAATAAASQIDPNDIQQVSAPSVGADQIAQYLNPYTSDVVNSTNAQLLQAEQQQQEANAAAATKAGAFGGSGSAVQNALSNRDYLQTLGSTDANLNSAGFNTALSAAQTEAAQKLAAATANQGTLLQAGTSNAGLAQQVALANQAAANSQAQFNASQGQQTNLTNAAAANSASQFNAAQAQTAAATNQANGLAGAGLNLSAAAQQGQLSAQELAQALGIQNAVMGVGAQAQTTQQAQDTANYNAYLNAQNWPLMLQQLQNQTLGLVGNPVLSNSQATSSGDSSGMSVGLSVGK
jgi:hypothetical protein